MIFTNLRYIGRIREVLGIFVEHDLLSLLNDIWAKPPYQIQIIFFLFSQGLKPSAGISNLRPGERLGLALQKLGPCFIKLGQALSVRSDIIGEEIANDLSALQDQLPPFSGNEARQAVVQEFGQPLEKIFKFFTDEPIAAASIAQVHFATTVDGNPVAVKVLRPKVEEAFARDLAFLNWLAKTTENHVPGMHRLRLVEVVQTLKRTVALEMDLRLEAAAGDELRSNFEEDSTFFVPKMDWARTGRRVLTTERIEGFPIDEIETIKKTGLDVKTLVGNMARILFLQVFRDGFFHADLHPGNLTVSPNGSIQAVDFGIMGRIDRQTRFYLAEMLIGFLNADYEKVASVHFRAGYVPATQSEDQFAQAARAIAEPIFGLPLKEISLARLLSQLFQITQHFEMEVQPQLLLLQKTMLVAEGVGRQLYPEANMWQLARPLIEEWMQEELTPEVRAAETLSEAGKFLERLPVLIAEMSDTVENLSRRGIRLHQNTLDAMFNTNKQKSNWRWWVGFLFVLGILFSLLWL